MRFLLFTKTNWDEAPRLRHQVARMLASRGHEVIFFQRPGYLATPRGSEGDPSSGVRLLRTRQLMHHQLRISRVLSAANAMYETSQLRKATAPLRGSPEPLGLLNFNYDYYFLGRVFPGTPVVTIINDDFVDAARISRRAASTTLRRTAQASLHNLAVSYPLVDQLREFTDRVSLFLPWARHAYRRPASSAQRTDLLYWGYINDRIDFEAVRHVLQAGVRVHFVGPVDGSAAARELVHQQNAEYHGAKPASELGPIAERCVASILPYNPAFRMVAATTMSNRAFDLLARGLPLIYSNLPRLLEAPEGIIYKCKAPPDYLAAYENAKRRFDAIQTDIQRFLEPHTEETRYRQLIQLFALPASSANSPERGARTAVPEAHSQ